MKFSYSWLKEFVQFPESPALLAEFLTLNVFEVESVTKHGNDWLLDIKGKTLANRTADASGHLGLAREIATLKDLRFKIQESRITESKRKAREVLKSVKVEHAEDCIRYTARVVDGVAVTSSPRWMRERLEACGLQPINNVVDAANYVMLELGQPLHVFDWEKLAGRAIMVRRARKGEKLLALDDKTYALDPDILVIADAKNAVGIAGIKGGKTSGVSARTKTLVLEAANFDRVLIRRASQKLGLKTDASYRFEHGLDPNETARAVDRLAELIVGVAGGEILSGRIDVYPRKLLQKKILFRMEYANRLIGAAIPQAFYENCFRRLGWKFGKKGERAYIVEIPTVRQDIAIEEDIVEEMSRLWGYDRIKSVPPATHVAPVHEGEERGWENRVRDLLVAAGMSESYVYEFIGERELSDFDESAARLLELENPTSPDTRFLLGRPMFHYARSAAENLRHVDAVSIFGIAKGFHPLARPSQERPADETKYLSLALAKKNDDDGETFFSLKGILDGLFDALGISEHWYDDALTVAERRETRMFHPYRVAQTRVNGDVIGLIGELHPETLKRLKSKSRIVLAEIDFETLWKRARSEAEYQPASRFPAVIRDIAVIVPENEKADTVLDVIENAGGALMTDADLFDYFQDEAMEERGEKSLAFHLIFQSPERTLTDAEVAASYGKIVAALRQKEWEIRG